ncbi:hypothetical protein GQ55_6G019700 [Panicum hallii var. hallii]|uniref:Uncharacterized protein n=1 Tax=Panicum hallii var. hallii TaxID=1504633 RepID=A0A2T7D307_9POAL|nr:hypothetical protein GQ55_6G019700 [Panicum hallii var. hallii]
MIGGSVLFVVVLIELAIIVAGHRSSCRKARKVHGTATGTWKQVSTGLLGPSPTLSRATRLLLAAGCPMERRRSQCVPRASARVTSHWRAWSASRRWRPNCPRRHRQAKGFGWTVLAARRIHAADEKIWLQIPGSQGISMQEELRSIFSQCKAHMDPQRLCRVS